MARPRKPTESLKTDGTFRKDRHGDRLDASHEFFAIPSSPTNLGKDGKKLWDMVVDELAAAKVVSELDAPALQAMCQWWQRYLDITAAIADMQIEDEEVEQLENRARRAWQSFDKVAARFGMTPSDRAKLVTAPKEGCDESPLSSLGIVG